MEHLSAVQVLELLKAARAESTRDWAMFLLTFKHALRSEEARQLKVSDIDLVQGTIRIERAKGSVSSTQALEAFRGEPTLDEFVALRAWRKERREDGSQILFPSQKGGKMQRMQFWRLFRKYAAQVGIPTTARHPHVLRHSACSLMAEEHKDLYEIRRKAGHKNIASTIIYTHVTAEQADKAFSEALHAAIARRA